MELRAELVLADICERRGEVPAAARLASHILRQAVELGDRPLLARVHRQLGRLRYEMGDRAGWLEEMARAVAFLDDETPLSIRGGMLGDLANALPSTATSKARASGTGPRTQRCSRPVSRRDD